MKNKEQLKYIPVMFQKIKDYTNEEIDSRFMKVRIWLMHLGRNLNGSYFEKSVVENAIPTLANTPILCFIEDKDNGEKGFSDHRMEIVKEKDGLKFKYLGQAIGTIPETNNAHFEMRLCDDGVEREYLVVDGLVWQKWDDPIDILNREKIVSQSMELHDDYKGDFGDDGYFHFTDFKFFGACCLGTAKNGETPIKPAMESSTVEVQFSESNIAKEVENKLKEFKAYFSFNNDGEVINLAKKKKENEVVEDTTKQNEEKGNVKQTEENKDKDTENTETVKDNEKATNSATEENVQSHNESGHSDVSTEMSKIFTKFNLGYEEIWYQLWDKLYSICVNDNRWYGIIKTTNDYFIYGDCEKTFKQSYKIEDNEVVFEGEREEVFIVIVDEENYKALTESNSTFAQVQKELIDNKTKIIEYEKEINILKKDNKELTDFRANVFENARKSEVDEVISKFSMLDEKELSSLKEQAYNNKIDKKTLEEKLFALLGQKNFSNFSKDTPSNTEEKPKYNMQISETEKCPYAGLENYFK